MLLVPCMWWLTVALVLFYEVARSARGVARRLFPQRPHGRVEDRPVLTAQRTRAWAALAVSGGLLAVYGGMSDAWEQFMQWLYLAPWLALASAVLVAGALYGAARRHRRRLMRTHFKSAGLRILGYAGAWVLLPALLIGSLLAMSAMLEPVAQTSLLLAYLIVLALWTPFWWIVHFLCFASGPAVRNAFSLSALHPALPPLTTSVAVWVFALVSHSTGDRPPFPEPLAVCAVVGGPVTVTALACWEIHRLRQHHGMQWRG
ncbi:MULTISPECIES: hypothetical protein [unclassified Streptomyces]|uniref:hypothetical protein n=1 Tax=unclassified Streptomyces TaxID=2593676 RepID=UPI000369E651|nr:hypothetical protein [Streptomyces sp. SID4923]